MQATALAVLALCAVGVSGQFFGGFGSFDPYYDDAYFGGGGFPGGFDYGFDRYNYDYRPRFSQPRGFSRGFSQPRGFSRGFSQPRYDFDYRIPTQTMRPPIMQPTRTTPSIPARGSTSGQVISYDLDGVLHSIIDDKGFGNPHYNIIDMVKRDSQRARIIVITARHPRDERIIKDFFRSIGLGDIVSEVIFTYGEPGRTLAGVPNVIKHTDDREENLRKISRRVPSIELFFTQRGRTPQPYY